MRGHRRRRRYAAFKSIYQDDNWHDGAHKCRTNVNVDPAERKGDDWCKYAVEAVAHVPRTDGGSQQTSIAILGEDLTDSKKTREALQMA